MNKQKILKSSKLPIQAAPVERNITGACMSSDKGVDPSLLGALTSLIPIAGKAIGSLF